MAMEATYNKVSMAAGLNWNDANVSRLDRSCQLNLWMRNMEVRDSRACCLVDRSAIYEGVLKEEGESWMRAEMITKAWKVDRSGPCLFDLETLRA